MSRLPRMRTVVVFALWVVAPIVLAKFLTGCDGKESGEAVGASPVEQVHSVGEAGNQPATSITAEANQATAAAIAELDASDLEAARRGLIASPDSLVVDGPVGVPTWNLDAYQFITGAAPDLVNPSLWRQAQLSNLAGLFEVADGVYQLRGFDLANMTLISGERGWIVVDPLTTVETARAALDFAFEHLPKRPISTVIFTHTHIDHFGGVFGVVTPEAVAAGDVEVIAPAEFMAEATSEMVLAGRVMGRRADYMYGRRLERSPFGHVGSGIGKEPAIGTMTIVAPTLSIVEPIEEHVVDGVPMVFKNVPHSEAPAEFLFYLPEQKALCGAELALRTLHNLYTLRGAKVRDGLRWSNYIDEALREFPDLEVVFNAHNWPVWGHDVVIDYLKQQRDLYKYIHDQTLRMAGQGMTPDEIAEAIELPSSLKRGFHTRDYYGTIRHNSRAVYQFYFGWYDANPAHLNPLSNVQSAPKYIALMGGADAVLTAASTAFDEGDYRWAAELLNRLVFAEPDNQDAAELLARSYEQLGYQAESGPWRDVYLTGAYELRHGAPEQGSVVGDVLGLMRETPVERIFETFAATLNGPEADGEHIVLNFNLTDLNRNFVLTLENAVLHFQEQPKDANASVTVNMTHDLLLRILLRRTSAKELVLSDDMDIEGSRIDLLRFLGLMQPHSGTFNIALP